MRQVDTLILCGGRGTRLRSVMSDRPKALAPVCGKPFLSYLLDQLADGGVRDIILCTGYKGELIEETFGSHYNGVSIRYSHEAEPLGTGGALRHAFPMIARETVLAMNGDSFCKTNFDELFAFHDSKRGIASMVLARSPDGTDYGVVTLDKDNRIIGFSEKVDYESDRYINAGIYLMRRDIMDHMPDAGSFSLEYEVFPRLTSLDFFGFVSDGELIDIGTPERLKHAEQFFGAFN